MNKKKPLQFKLEDEDYMADHKAAFLSKPTFWPSAILYTVIVLLVSLCIWAYFGKIDQITVAEGKVIPSTEDKIIQSLDGGIIAQILVQEGEIVKPGQVLVKLDDTRYAADYRTGYQKYLALSAQGARLEAEVENRKKIDFSEDVIKQRPELVSRETHLFNTRQKNLEVELGNLNHSLEISKKELNMFLPLLSKGYVSNFQYLEARRNYNEINQRILEKRNKYHEEAATQLNQLKAEFTSLKEQLTTLRDKMTRTTLVSPVYGVVKQIHVTTIGGVISPSMPIMDIVPLKDSLVIQVKVRPSDIAFIKKGQEASVKLTAYDYTIYGSLKGVVEYISPDAIEERKQLQTTGQTYYLVNIRTAKNFIESGKAKLPIIPGMTALVQIKTGKHTVMSYILKPILKAKAEALREK